MPMFITNTKLHYKPKSFFHCTLPLTCMEILQTATLLSVYDSCHYSQRIAVVVGVPSMPPPRNPPSLEEVNIKHELGVLDC